MDDTWGDRILNIYSNIDGNDVKEALIEWFGRDFEGETHVDLGDIDVSGKAVATVWFQKAEDASEATLDLMTHKRAFDCLINTSISSTQNYGLSFRFKIVPEEGFTLQVARG